jgi:hypothetical protein
MFPIISGSDGKISTYILIPDVNGATGGYSCYSPGFYKIVYKDLNNPIIKFVAATTYTANIQVPMILGNLTQEIVGWTGWVE